MQLNIPKPALTGLVTLLMLLGAAALSAPALAAAPEEPETGKAEPVTNTTALLHGTVNPKVLANVSWYFAYKEGAECAGGATTPVEPTEGFTETEAHSVETKITGLTPGAHYTYCLVARNETEEITPGKPEAFTTTAFAPVISEESLSSIGSSEANLTARIDTEGSSTEYWIKYGTTENYESETSYVSLGAPVGSVSVVTHLTDLLPSTAYHLRVFAQSVLGLTEGHDVKFTTRGSAGSSSVIPPDERAYELVSPLDNKGEVYAPEGPALLNEDVTTSKLFRASANGNVIAYQAEPAASGGNGATGPGEGNQWLGSRSAEGWSAGDITPASSGLETAYDGFSSDLRTGFLQSDVQPSLALGAPADCKVLYSRENVGGTYEDLLTETTTPGNCGHPHFAGMSSDGAEVIFQSEAALTDGSEEAENAEGHESHTALGPSAGEPCQFSCNLYSSGAGQLRAVNLLPDGKEVPNATFGGSSGSENPSDFSNALSQDGTHTFWTDTQPGRDFEHVFVRENPGRPSSPLGAKGECLVPADACTFPVSEGAAKYWTATPDGSFAFYTEDETLWRFDVTGHTRELLVATGLRGESAGVLGVIGINESGSGNAYLYFVATGLLADNSNSQGEKALTEVGKDNLYVLHGGVMTFIAVLSAEDDSLSGVTQATLRQFGDWQPDLGGRTAEVTSDGRHVVFESVRALTGYNNVNTATGARDVEVFVYAADSKLIVCASCDTIGAAPRVPEGAQRTTALPVSQNDTYMKRWISEDGNEVFFDTRQALTPQDTNRAQDVYEWEREGSPSCSSAMNSSGGCVFLLSGGQSKDYSYFVDASADGANVFFTHRGQLGDTSVFQEKTSLYDARVDGGFPKPSLACIGTGCQGVPPAPPVFATPSSVTFNGIGNFSSPPATKKIAKKKPIVCVKTKKPKRGACARGKSKKKRKKSKMVSKGRRVSS